MDWRSSETTTEVQRPMGQVFWSFPGTLENIEEFKISTFGMTTENEKSKLCEPPPLRSQKLKCIKYLSVF